MVDPSRAARRVLSNRLRWLESSLDARRHHFDRHAPGNLAPLAAPLDRVTALQRGRFLATDEHARLTVPGGPFAAGHYVFAVHVVPTGTRTTVQLEARLADVNGEHRAEGFALACRRERPVFRIVHLREPAQSLTLLPMDHAGEFERLFPGKLAHRAGRIEAVRNAAALTGSVVLLKGADTVIAAPDGRAVVNTHATPFLATAGAGDVLAGIIGGLLAQGLSAFDAACAAAWMHGDAGLRVGAGLTAEDLDQALRGVLHDLHANRHGPTVIGL